MKILYFFLPVLLFSCISKNHVSKPVAVPPVALVKYDTTLSISDQDTSSFKYNSDKRLSLIADSSRSYCQIEDDTLYFNIRANRHEVSGSLHIIINKDTASAISWINFDNDSYKYILQNFTITLNRKVISPGGYVIADVYYKAIGESKHRDSLFYTDTIVFSGKIRLKVRDEKFTELDFLEEYEKNKFYSLAKNNPTSVKLLSFTCGKWYSKLPREILLFTNLEILSFRGKNVGKIDLTLLRDLPNLKQLYLSDCNLSNVSPVIGSLKGLEFLDLSSNHLNKIPDCIYKLSTLSVLIISSNNISILPARIKKLKNLAILQIEKTGIVRLPDALLDLRKLERIETNDTMKYIPDALCKYIWNRPYIQK